MKFKKKIQMKNKKFKGTCAMLAEFELNYEQAKNRQKIYPKLIERKKKNRLLDKFLYNLYFSIEKFSKFHGLLRPTNHK